MRMLLMIRRWIRRATESLEEVAGGGIAVASPPHGELNRETSTNAQVEGAVGQPWPGVPMPEKERNDGRDKF